MPQVEFPHDGLIKDEGHYRLYATAMGRNGTAEIAALEVRANDAWVTLQPVTRKKRLPLNCWIEIPREPVTLLQLAKELVRIADPGNAPRAS